MKNMFSLLKAIWRANFKTIYFNFKYLPWQQALRFPFWVSSKTYLRRTRGSIIIKAPLQTGMIRIGYGDIGIFDKKRSRTIWEVAGRVVFEGKAEIGHGSKISVGPEGLLQLGTGFAITAETSIIAYKKVSFGNDCLLSWEIQVMDTDFHTITGENGAERNPPAEINIGNHVWIGCRSMILKGATIPDGCVIAANSLVSKQLDGENQVFGGHPVSTLSQNICWHK